MPGESRPLAALALALVTLISLIGAGCGSTEPSETGAAAGTATGRNETATDRDTAVKFAACMRDNGVSDFPDPDAKGEFAYGVSVTPTTFTRACSTPPSPAAAG